MQLNRTIYTKDELHDFGETFLRHIYMSNTRQEDYLTVRYGKYFGQLSIIPIILSTSIIPSTMHNVHETTH
jgi:hypothetical protein